jgi:acetolactate synthase-1/2/3 large subunit
MAMLEAALGVPVVCMESPRGVADPGLGAFAQMLAKADCILLLGKRLDFTLKIRRPRASRGDVRSCRSMREGEESRRARASPRAVEQSAVAPLFERDAGAHAGSVASAPPVARGWQKCAPHAITARGVGEGIVHVARALHPVQALAPAAAARRASRFGIRLRRRRVSASGRRRACALPTA